MNDENRLWLGKWKGQERQYKISLQYIHQVLRHFTNDESFYKLKVYKINTSLKGSM